MDRRDFIQKLTGLGAAALITPNFLQTQADELTTLKNPQGGLLMKADDKPYINPDTFIHRYVHTPDRREVILGTVFRYVNIPNSKIWKGNKQVDMPPQNIFVSTFLKPMVLDPALPEWMIATTSGGSGREFDFYVLVPARVHQVYVKFLYQEPDIDYTRIWNNA